MLNLAELLRAAREARDIPQQVVADALGLPRTAITDIESGNRAISTLELTRMAELYGRSAAYFLGETDDEAEQDIFARLRQDLPVVAGQQESDESAKRLIDLFEMETGLKTLLGHKVDRTMSRYASIMDKIRKSGTAASNRRPLETELRHRLVRLTLDAYRQGEISKGRIIEICGKLRLDAAPMIKLADATAVG